MKTLLTLAATAALSATALTGALAQDKSYTIGVSNGWVGSEWRTQMIQETQEAAEAWGEQGVEVELLVQSKNIDVQGQIADVRNFINQGVDAILVNPNSPTAFNPVFAQAAQAGIVVVATDGEVASPDALFVGIDQKEWAKQSARWLAEALEGEGQVATVNGIAGHPANQARVEGYEEVFAEFPGIEVVNAVNADWDSAKAQQATQTLLATYPDLDAIWTQDGHAEGVWRALETEGKTDLPVTGELRKSFVEQWNDKGWTAAASVNPPGAMANALHVAVMLLEGGELKEDALAGPNENALYVPVPLVTSDNIAEIAEGMSDESDAYFQSLVEDPQTLKERFFQ